MNEDSEILNLKPRLSDFKREIKETLQDSPKTISPKFFYDDAGSRLFGQITELEEYYPTRSELEILETRCSEIAGFIGEGAVVIELGGGDGTKGSMLLKCLLHPESYVLVDISRDSLDYAKERLREKYPGVDIRAVWADYTRQDVMEKLNTTDHKALVFFGSTIGNMEPDEAQGFIRQCREILSDGESFTIGVDLKKDIKVLEKAYNDSRGITARFNRNLITRINREFGAGIDEDSFAHLAFYNSEKGRIEMHLESLRKQEFRLDDITVSFRKGETIHTENSYKYSREEFFSMLRNAGFNTITDWVDSGGNYALFSAKVS